MDGLKDYLNMLPNAWKKRGRWSSLLVFEFVLFLSEIALLPHILPDGFIGQYWGLYISGLLTSLLILAFVWWVFWRRIPAFSEGEIGFIFAPSTDDECEALVSNLCKRMRKNLSTYQDKIVLKNLIPYDIHIDNAESARKLLERTNGRIAIYGDIQKGPLEGNEVQGFREFSFTVRHKPLSALHQELMKTSIIGAFSSRKLIADESNFFIERNLVADNITDFSEFFIAVSLTLEDKYDQSIQMLERLLRKTIGNQGLAKFEDVIKKWLIVSYEGLIDVIYDRDIVNSITVRDNKVDEASRTCVSILDKLVRVSDMPLIYNTYYAIFEFHFGDIESARRHLIAAKAFYRRGRNPNAIISLAFLDLWEGKYLNALKKYTAAGNFYHYDEIEERVYYSIMNFLDGLVSRNEDRPQIYFAMAFIDDKYGNDAMQTIGEYNAFLERMESSRHKELNPLRAFAKRRLASLTGT